ncbi:hypothetical protein BC828DRAFT_373433 [Blastocladiella britannica]|nr:hypothetical protein BC828DRAFT_373433 [Blastocladiella britannica]
MVRYKYRYLVFTLNYAGDNVVDPSVDQGEMERVLRAAVELNFGPHGLGLVQSNFTVRYFSGFTGIGVARVGRDFYRTLWAALSMLTTLKSKKCRIVVLHCSGTMRKAQLAALKHDRIQLDVALSRMPDPDLAAAKAQIAKIGDLNQTLIDMIDTP